MGVKPRRCWRISSRTPWVRHNRIIWALRRTRRCTCPRRPVVRCLKSPCDGHREACAEPLSAWHRGSRECRTVHRAPPSCGSFAQCDSQRTPRSDLHRRNASRRHPRPAVSSLLRACAGEGAHRSVRAMLGSPQRTLKVAVAIRPATRDVKSLKFSRRSTAALNATGPNASSPATPPKPKSVRERRSRSLTYYFATCGRTGVARASGYSRPRRQDRMRRQFNNHREPPSVLAIREDVRGGTKPTTNAEICLRQRLPSVRSRTQHRRSDTSLLAVRAMDLMRISGLSRCPSAAERWIARTMSMPSMTSPKAA